MQATRTTKSPKYIIFVAYVVLTFECYIQHSNVATFEGSFKCRTFVYALLMINI